MMEIFIYFLAWTIIFSPFVYFGIKDSRDCIDELNKKINNL